MGGQHRLPAAAGAGDAEGRIRRWRLADGGGRTSSIGVSAGAGLDDADVEGLDPGARDRNRVAWLNAICDVRAVLQTELELSWWETEYARLADGSSTRVQWSLI